MSSPPSNIEVSRSPESEDTEMGTSCTFCSWRCAVTTSSSSVPEGCCANAGPALAINAAPKATAAPLSISDPNERRVVVMAEPPANNFLNRPERDSSVVVQQTAQDLLTTCATCAPSLLHPDIPDSGRVRVSAAAASIPSNSLPNLGRSGAVLVLLAIAGASSTSIDRRNGAPVLTTSCIGTAPPGGRRETGGQYNADGILGTIVKPAKLLANAAIPRPFRAHTTITALTHAIE